MSTSEGELPSSEVPPVATDETVQACPGNFREIFATLRGVVEHEDNLIDHRFTWLLVIEGLLITAAVDSNLSATVFLLPVAVLGSLLSFLFGITTIGAVASIRECLKKWSPVAKALSESNHSEAASMPQLAYKTNGVLNYTYVVLLVTWGIIPLFWFVVYFSSGIKT